MGSEVTDGVRDEVVAALGQRAEWHKTHGGGVEPNPEFSLLCDVWRDRARLRARLAAAEKVAEALEFYAGPGTYFGIGFFPDPPCGEFVDDFSETELGQKPGKRARDAMAAWEEGKNADAWFGPENDKNTKETP